MASPKIKNSKINQQEQQEQQEQQITFTNWCNSYLPENRKINNLFEDLKDGLLLYEILKK